MADKKKYYKMKDDELFDVMEGNMPHTHSSQEYANRLLSLRASSRMLTAAWISAGATIILVVITAFYAWFNFQMAIIMKDQIVADIKIESVTLESQLETDWFQERLRKWPENIDIHSSTDYRLYLYVSNRKSGNGSIMKPNLILRFGNNGKEFVAAPKTKSYEYQRESTGATRVEARDLGKALFLRGGESIGVELKYELKNSKQFIDCLIGHIDKLEYFIQYQDNLGKKFIATIKNVKPYKF